MRQNLQPDANLLARFGHAQNSPTIDAFGTTSTRGNVAPHGVIGKRGEGEAKRATTEYPVRTLRGAIEWCREHAAVVSFTEESIVVEAADLKARGRTFLLAVKDAQRILMQRGGGK